MEIKWAKRLTARDARALRNRYSACPVQGRSLCHHRCTRCPLRAQHSSMRPLPDACPRDWHTAGGRLRLGGYKPTPTRPVALHKSNNNKGAGVGADAGRGRKERRGAAHGSSWLSQSGPGPGAVSRTTNPPFPHLYLRLRQSLLSATGGPSTSTSPQAHLPFPLPPPPPSPPLPRASTSSTTRPIRERRAAREIHCLLQQARDVFRVSQRHLRRRWYVKDAARPSFERLQIPRGATLERACAKGRSCAVALAGRSALRHPAEGSEEDEGETQFRMNDRKKREGRQRGGSYRAQCKPCKRRDEKRKEGIR